MKTNLFFQKNIVLFSITGLLCFLVVACSPYQNSLYYDNDGIYGATTDNYTQKVAAYDTKNQYKEYFSSLQKDINPTEIFTNVDNYSSYNKSGDSIAKSGTGYPAWGSNVKDVSVNVYPSTWGFYGLGYGYPYYGGFGWNYPYYGGFGYDYGWNYPYYSGFGYGYGWNNSYYGGYGWNNPYYYGGGWSYPSYYPYYDRHGQYNNNYSYSSGRRGNMYNNGVNRSGNYSNRNADYSTGRRGSSDADYQNSSPNIIRNSYNNSVYTTTRRYQPLGTQSYSPTQTNQSYSPQNTYTPTRRDYDSNTITRSYDYSPSRSSYNSGAGMSGGGGGVGRSYSSGRR